MTDNSLKESDAPLSFTSDRFDRDKYAAVAAAAKFRDVRLTKQNYTIKQELYTGLGGLDEPNFAYGGEPREIHFELDDGVLIGSYSWTVIVKLKRKQVLSHKAEFLLIYSNLSEKEPEYFHMYF